MMIGQNFHGGVDTYDVKVVDRTGAGDSFVGALLSKIVDDHAIIQVLKYIYIYICTFHFIIFLIYMKLYIYIG